MAIDRTGRWWKGKTFDDLAEYLRQFTAGSYPVTTIVRCSCGCGGGAFRLRADSDEGGVERTCVACGLIHLVCDSEEYWDTAEPRRVTCPCRATVYEVAVGFALREDGDVRWITVGNRCVKCGVLASCADWKIDYAPTSHLLTSA
jgi:hypothetical protein